MKFSFIVVHNGDNEAGFIPYSDEVSVECDGFPDKQWQDEFKNGFKEFLGEFYDGAKIMASEEVADLETKIAG